MDKIIELIKAHPDQINAMAATCALFVSALSLFLTIATLWYQRRHNYKSLTPIAHISVGDYEGEINVRLSNRGIGPLIVHKLLVSDGKQELNDIISWMPPLPKEILWATFTGNIEGDCISPGQDSVLLKLEGDPDDEAFASFRDDVRLALSRLTVTVRYNDVYDRKMPEQKRDLDWFARNLAALNPAAHEEKKLLEK